MPSPALESISFTVKNYDLGLTLASGQAFRWHEMNGVWEAVVGSRWLGLRQEGNHIYAQSIGAGDWQWLRHYLQLDIRFDEILATFPRDEQMRMAVEYCRGMRLLRQEPWECLASFICSSTKQIVQIQQIVENLSQRFGEPLINPVGEGKLFAFPTVARLAEATEAELRECKLGFRAPYLLGTARALVAGKIDLTKICEMSLEEARAALVELPGVGAKVADCVLLSGYGFPQAFPIDVWIARALRELYFPKRRPTERRLIQFSQTYFGPHSGYAQQYLFHYMRTAKPRRESLRR